MNIRFRSVISAAAWIWLGAAGSVLAAEQGSNQPRTLTETEMIFRSDRLGDLDVYNQNDTNQKLGNLDGLLVDGRTGQVLYAILDTGLGGKTIPVPWNALHLQMTASDNDRHYWLTLNKTQDALANAPTLNRDRWPDFTDSAWKQSVDHFFGLHSAARPEDGSGQSAASPIVFESDRLSDLNAYNRHDRNQELGGLANLIINAHTGQVLYGVLDRGVNEKRIAVPWNAFEMQKAADADRYFLTLNKTQDELARAPAFDENRMSDVVDSRWQQDVHRFFGVRMAAKPEQR